MSKILISGSLAYDCLYTYPGVFKQELFASKLGSLSAAFMVENKTIHFGGCAGNIAYNGKLLDEDFVILGIAGRDFDEYEKWLHKNHISTEYVVREPNEFTSQASVVTDSRGQQITFFYEGAAKNSSKHKNEIKKNIHALGDELVLAHVAPHNRDFTLAVVEACREMKLPFIFDPGQAMPAFSANELLDIAKSAAGIFFNESELYQFEQLAGIKKTDAWRLCPLMVVTLGEKGSAIYYNGNEIKIPADRPKHAKDPTGCGDAYRAGFLAEIKKTFPRLTPEVLKKAGVGGTRLATACLETTGTQNHRL